MAFQIYFTTCLSCMHRNLCVVHCAAWCYLVYVLTYTINTLSICVLHYWFCRSVFLCYLLSKKTHHKCSISFGWFPPFPLFQPPSKTPLNTKRGGKVYFLLTREPFSVTLVRRLIHIPDCHSTQPGPSFIPFSSFKPWPLSSICLSGQDLTSHLQSPAHLVTPNPQLIVSLTANG